MKARNVILLLLFSLMGLTASAQRFAVKTNLLSLTDGSLNAGVGYALGQKTTIDLSGSIRPWKRTEDYVNHYWVLQSEYRHWFCQKFDGHFIGGYINGAQYNIGGKKMPFGIFPSLKRRRYAGWLAGVGFKYGYQWMLDRHWNVEASLGVGYEYIDYTKYKCPVVCASKMKDGKYHYFGPSSASISIVYLF